MTLGLSYVPHLLLLLLLVNILIVLMELRCRVCLENSPKKNTHGEWNTTGWMWICCCPHEWSISSGDMKKFISCNKLGTSCEFFCSFFFSCGNYETLDDEFVCNSNDGGLLSFDIITQCGDQIVVVQHYVAHYRLVCLALFYLYLPIQKKCFPSLPDNISFFFSSSSSSCCSHVA